MNREELLEILDDELLTAALKSLLRKEILSKGSTVNGLDLTIDEHLDFVVDNFITFKIDPIQGLNDLIAYGDKLM